LEAAPTFEYTLSRVHFLARISVAAVWVYQGLIPKIWFRDWSEMILLRQMGVDIHFVPAVLKSFGYLEICFGLIVIINWHARWPLMITIGAMVGGLVGIARHSPAVFHAAFNPLTLNGLMLVMATIALMTLPPRKRPG